MTNCYHKWVKHMDNIFTIKLVKGLKSITLNTQIHQICDNKSQNLLRLTIMEKAWKNVWRAQRYP